MERERGSGNGLGRDVLGDDRRRVNGLVPHGGEGVDRTRSSN
jgi:hypothetical protein